MKPRTVKQKSVKKASKEIDVSQEHVEAYALQVALLGALVARRDSLGLTQEELAKRAGVSRLTVQRAEKPGSNTALSTVIFLARALSLIPTLKPVESEEGYYPAPKDMVHRGTAYNRTKYEPEWRDRQRERALAHAWEAANEHHDVGLSAIMPWLVPDATQAQATAVATAIQWLGSEVGFDFLRKALDQAGYTIIDSREPATKPSKKRGAVHRGF